ncbi:MAG: hypothetical protein ILO43_02885 [Clostridia bacterium]|nr:hypothetical protein [Clostridia bacterium]
MKQRMINIVCLMATLIITMMFLLVGCSHNKATVDATEANYQDVTVISPYEKAADEYKKIIEGLPEGSAYAFADMSKDHDVLLVTEAPITFNGEMDAAKATVYGYDAKGDIKKYGTIESNSTSMPIVVKDGYAYFGSHHYVSRATVDEKNSKLVVETAKEGDKKYDAFFKAYNGGTIVNFTKNNVASAKADKAKAKDKTTKKAVENEEMEYISPDGWRVRYDPKAIAANEIDKHAAQFVYQGKAAGSCLTEIKYIADKQPEEVLYEVTSEWGDQEKIQRSEGFFPGTDDKWAFWRVLPDNGKGSRLSMTAIATEYNGGVLLAVETFHSSGKDDIDMAASDALANVIDSITFKNFKEQKMYSYVPGTYKAADKNAKFQSITLNKDHTGVLTDSKGKKASLTWGSIELTAKDGSFKYQYDIEGDNLLLEVKDGNWVEFSK